jgi:aminoglycoside 3-N-acetyltransferase I
MSATPRPAYLERLLASEDLIALVALKNGCVIGGLIAYELHKFEQERSEIYIYALAVAGARGSRRLIGEIRGIAAARGAYVIFVQTDIGDEPAIALHRSFVMRRRAAVKGTFRLAAASGFGWVKKGVEITSHRLRAPR